MISVPQVQLFTINQIYNELSDLEVNSSAGLGPLHLACIGMS